MTDSTFRLNKLRPDIDCLMAARDLLEEGPAAGSIDLLVAGKRLTLSKLEQVAEDLERVTGRRNA